MIAKEIASNIYIAEYEALRKEILLQIGHQNSVINYSILLIGIGLTLITGNIETIQKYPIILLLFSILLSGLIIYYFQLAILLAILTNYIKTQLVPRISIVVGPKYPVLWEKHNATFNTFSIPTILTISKLVIPYVANVSFLVYFCIQRNAIGGNWPPLDFVIFICAILVLTLTALMPILTLSYRRAHYRG